jgi:hypothetical protein
LQQEREATRQSQSTVTNTPRVPNSGRPARTHE